MNKLVTMNEDPLPQQPHRAPRQEEDSEREINSKIQKLLIYQLKRKSIYYFVSDSGPRSETRTHRVENLEHYLSGVCVFSSTAFANYFQTPQKQKFDQGKHSIDSLSTLLEREDPNFDLSSFLLTSLSVPTSCDHICAISIPIILASIHITTVPS